MFCFSRAKSCLVFHSCCKACEVSTASIIGCTAASLPFNKEKSGIFSGDRSKSIISCRESPFISFNVISLWGFRLSNIALVFAFDSTRDGKKATTVALKSSVNGGGLVLSIPLKSVTAMPRVSCLNFTISST